MADPEKKSLLDAINSFFMMIFGLLIFYVGLSGGKFADMGFFEMIGELVGATFAFGMVYIGGKDFISTITAVGEQGNANRSTLIIIGLFLLILVVVVFGTILVLK
jgi:hypothetical protein